MPLATPTPHTGRVIGLVYEIKNTGKNGKIVSLGETSKAWSIVNVTTGATSLNNGKENMTKIQGITDWKTKHPAFAWCADIGGEWLDIRHISTILTNNKTKKTE